MMVEILGKRSHNRCVERHCFLLVVLVALLEVARSLTQSL